LLADWPGKLNLALSSRGVLAEGGPRGNVDIARLDGILRGRPIAGDGAIEFAAPSTLSGALQVRSGKSRVAVKGGSAGKQGIDANVDLAIASLGDWVPDAAGSLTGNFRVRGEWPKLNVAGTANGKSLAFGENRVATLALNASVDSPLDPAGKLRASATKVSAAGFEFATVSLSASGNQAKHEVSVEADGEKLDAAVAVAGGLARGGWRGQLTKLTLGLPNVANLALRAPSSIVAEDGSFGITQTCLDDGDSVLCAAGKMEASGAFEGGYSFEKVPLALANAIAPDAMPGQLRGEVAGHGGVKRGVDGQWLGDARITSPAARLVMLDEKGDTAALGQRTWLIYENLEVQADLRGMNATATLTAALMNGGSLKANLGASNLTAEAPAIEGRIEASFPTLAPFGAFVPSIANLDGAVNADIRLGGTIQMPEVTGTVDAQRLQVDLGEIGIELRDGRLQAEAKRGGGFVLAASVASGKGHLELAGTMSDRGVIDAKILGQNFQAADIPAANVVLTPDLKLTGDPKLYLLRGEVTIPRAAINLQKLPQDQPPGVSPDVVVVRNGKEVEREKEAAGFPIDASILVKLGERIEIQGYGLDATVTGQLTVREMPGVPTSGSGTLQVSGRYRAYGQDLTIRDGRLLFAGTPLDNPRLAIVAMRSINDRQSTGLRIVGSAQRPIITVISEPNVGEADALSYLVTGRSLNDVGSASGSSQDALASATQSLEGAGAGLVAKRIGQRLGLDEAGVEENEMIGGSALTIGEYLSPRLYLSYGVGLFEPGEVVALRYKLTDDIGVKVQRGSEETRAGVEYRIEK
ncbi:MAG: translocation/assembly module TamB domain-containing protein, partial [Steroidobacteraceae bacterium]|nr:translocation/assembly module TamB domain-containing protein [Steroidobacteraceae bacterium]